MRVTNSMITNDLRRNLSNNLERMSEMQTQISTERRINTPSDDPAGTVKSLRLRTNLVEGKQYLRNIGEAQSFMDTTDSTFTNINEIVQKIRGLTVQGATATNSEQANSAIATQINELNNQLKMLANTTYGDTYIFAGSNVTETPYQNGKWTGNDETLEVEIGVGIKVPMNTIGMREYFMGKLNNLEIDTANTGINSIEAKDLQEGNYKISTAVGATAQSQASETQSYLSALASNGSYFYQGANSPATLGVGKGPAALANDSSYNGSLLIETKKVALGEPRYTFTSSEANITFEEAIYTKDGTGALCALPAGGSDFKNKLTYTGTGSLYSAQYNVDASGSGNIQFKTDGAVDGDTITWNNDLGGAAGSGAGKAYDKDGNAFAPITFTYNGTSNRWEYSGPTTPSTVTADIKGNVYSSNGEYKYVELSNVTLNMETGAGQEIFRIPSSAFNNTDGTADPNFTEDLVIYNNGTIALGGIDPTNPQLAVGDKAVISLSGQATAVDSQQVNFNYEFSNIDGDKIGEGSHSYVFDNGTFDYKIQDLKFFTLNQQTGLSYNGGISQDTTEFAADNTAAEFDYQAGLFGYVDDLTRKVELGKLPEVGDELKACDVRLNELLMHQATVGARVNRIDLQQGWLKDTQTNFTSLLSKNEGADMAALITDLKAQENIYNASLSVGARIIQPTLMDFLG